MTLFNKKEKIQKTKLRDRRTLSYMLPVMVLSISGLTITPVFAASSTGYPYWSVDQAISDSGSSCDSSSNSCSLALSSGINYLFAKSYYSLGSDYHYAYARNQESISPDSTASPHLS